MWTRHIIAVKQAWVFKVANYGQWDGYPTGQGEAIRAFLSEVDMDIFKEKISACRAITSQELEDIPDVDENWVEWPEAYPWLSRDAWASILSYIMEDKSVLKMAENCLTPNMWIEWSYLINLDAMTLSVYRWSILSHEKYVRKPNDHRPAAALHTYSLDNLPTKTDWLHKYARY